MLPELPEDWHTQPELLKCSWISGEYRRIQRNLFKQHRKGLITETERLHKELDLRDEAADLLFTIFVG
jgi:hypothetical protein